MFSAFSIHCRFKNIILTASRLGAGEVNCYLVLYSLLLMICFFSQSWAKSLGVYNSWFLFPSSVSGSVFESRDSSLSSGHRGVHKIQLKFSLHTLPHFIYNEFPAGENFNFVKDKISTHIKKIGIKVRKFNQDLETQTNYFLGLLLKKKGIWTKLSQRR